MHDIFFAHAPHVTFVLYHYALFNPAMKELEKQMGVVVNIYVCCELSLKVTYLFPLALSLLDHLCYR